MLISMPVVSNKLQMFDLWRNGVFGNRLKVWTISEMLEEKSYSGLVGVRCLGKPGLPYVHHISVLEGIAEATKLSKTYNVETAIFEASPDNHIILQGEMIELDGIFDLRCTRVKKSMRDAFKEEEMNCIGFTAKYMLKNLMSEVSWQEFERLLEEFPEHVYEFTIYDMCLGVNRGCNTIWWEVRKY